MTLSGRVGMLALAGAALAVACTLVAWAVPSFADEAKVPTGETVLEKAIQAMGGREPLQTLQTRRAFGRIEIGGMGIRLNVVATQDREGRIRTTMQSDVMGNMEEGGNGEVFWSSDMRGPALKKGAELARARRDADFDGLASWKTWFASVETVGADSVEGKPVWKVLMTPKEGPVETWYFEQESGLPLRNAFVVQSPQGEISTESTLSDYRSVDGVLMPFHTRQSLMGGMQVMEVYLDSVRHNFEVPDEFYDPPAEVKALIEKEKAGGAAPEGKLDAPPPGQPKEAPAGTPAEQPKSSDEPADKKADQPAETPAGTGK